MAIHAPLHGHLYPRFRRRDFTLTDVPMAGLALYLSQDDMTPVGIEDVIGLTVQTFPGDFLSLFLELPDLLFFRAFGDRFLVTSQAYG